jgi:phage shock protein A
MFFRRLFNLLGGKLTRWINGRESRDPEAVYEAAIAERLHRYRQLKEAAAGVIYMRNKLTRELTEKTVEIKELAEQAEAAVDMHEDECALILLQRKEPLEADCRRLRDELGQLTREAEEAKKNLLAFNGEIEKLRIEKTRMVARLRNAQARIRIQNALDSLSHEEDVRALEEVRDYIQRTLASVGANFELNRDTAASDKLDQIRQRQSRMKAEAELEELRRKRRPPLAPLDIFQRTAPEPASTGANGTADR